MVAIPFLLLLSGVAVAAGYGALCLGLLGLRPSTKLQGGLECVGVGLGFLAYLTLLLAACGLLYPELYAAVAAAGLAALWCQRGVFRLRSHAGPMPRWGWALILVGGLLLGGEALKLMAPPIGGDQTKYQLVFPRLFAEAHGLVDTPWSFWGNVQYLLNWLFTAAFVVEGDRLARLFHALFGILTALALYGFGRACFDAAVGLVAAAVFFSAPITTTLMTQAWVDLGVVFYTLMALWAFVRWWGTGRGSELLLAAIMAGLAGATKPLGLATALVLGLGIVWRLLGALCAEGGAEAGRSHVFAASRFLANGVAFLALTGVVASPCYLRNLANTGNPVYPFAYSLFGGRAWSAEAASYLDQYYRTYRQTHASKRPAHRGERPLVKLLRAGWDLTMYPNSYEQTSRSGYDLSPFLLACLPLALMGSRRKVIGGLLAFGAVYSLVVSVAWVHPRYLLPGLVPLVLACSAGLLTAFSARSWRAVAAAVTVATVGLSSLLSLEMLSWHWRDDWAVATGRMTEDAYLERYDKRYDLSSLVNSQVPPTGKVLLLDKIPHPYHLRRSFVSGSYLEQGFIDYHSIERPEELLREALRLGITHVAEAGMGEAADPFEAHVFDLWRAFLGRFCRLVAASGEAKLYALSVPGQVTRWRGKEEALGG